MRWLYAIGDVAARLGSACLRGPRQRLLERLSIAFDTDLADPRLGGIATRYFRNAILRFLDDLMMDRLFREGHLRKVEMVNLTSLTEALSAGKGVLLVGGHFFASRLAKRYLAEIGYPCMSVRNHQPPDPWAGQLGLRLLQKRYMAFLGEVLRDEVPIHDPDCSLKMLARLRSGRLVECLVDAPLSTGGILHKFLGAEVGFPAGFLQVARLAGCPLLPVHYSGNSRGLRIEFGQPLRLEGTPGRRDLAEAHLPAVLGFLEEHIRNRPAEWDLWIRW